MIVLLTGPSEGKFGGKIRPFVRRKISAENSNYLLLCTTIRANLNFLRMFLIRRNNSAEFSENFGGKFELFAALYDDSCEPQFFTYVFLAENFGGISAVKLGIFSDFWRGAGRPRQKSKKMLKTNCLTTWKRHYTHVRRFRASFSQNFRENFVRSSVRSFVRRKILAEFRP